MSKKNILLCFFSFLIFINTGFGQDSLPDVKEIVNKAAQQQVNYSKVFTNLIAEENKVVELYDENGDVKKRRRIVSTFIVYTRSENSAPIAEFRNVLSVDGKPIKNSEKRAQKFFEKLVKAGSSEKDLETINKESLRYDRYLKISGFTISQALTLSENLMPYFDFQFVRQEKFEGNDVYVVSYRQLRESPDIKITAPEDIKLNDILSGLIWIDTKTFQVWKEERERTIQPEMFNKPVITSKETYEYQKSDFGILTPKRISYTNYAVKILQKTSVKDAMLTLEYSKFSKPETEVKSADVK